MSSDRAQVIKNMINDINKVVQKRNTSALTIQNAIRGKIARKKTQQAIEEKAYTNRRQELMKQMKKDAKETLRKEAVAKGMQMIKAFRDKKKAEEQSKMSYADVLKKPRRVGRPKYTTTIEGALRVAKGEKNPKPSNKK